MFVCLDLGYVCHAMCYCSPFVVLSFFFLCFGLLVRTRSRPYGLCHCPYTLAHIKGFGSFLFACLCLLASMLVLAFLVLGFTTLDALSGFVVVWLHPTPMRLCSDVTIWEASLNAGLLRVYHSLFRFSQCYACHACLCHPLAFYASLHTCSHVHAWVLLASVSSTPQHNEVMDIQSKPTFVPRRHHLLFAFLLVCLYASLLAMPIMLNHFMPFHMLCIFSFHFLSAGFLYLPLHVHTWSEDAWS